MGKPDKTERRPAKNARCVIIERWQHRPAFVLLGENEGGAGLALGIERVKSLLQAFFGGFSCVNGGRKLEIGHLPIR
jgi:hypothetical protein